MRKPKWSVERVKKSFHEVTNQEMKRRLAEVWEILLNGDCQLNQVSSFLPSPILINRHPLRLPLDQQRRKFDG